MNPVFTYETHNCGDQLVFLHLLRALAKQNPDQQFVHFCGAHHHVNLRDVVVDIPNILLDSFESPLWGQNKNTALNVWKNLEDMWVESPLRWDWSNFTIWHHKVTSRRMGFESPFTCREHLLFDYPALEPDPKCPLTDFLVVNSEPCSGQFGPMKEHGSGYLDELVRNLAEKHTVITTNPVEGVTCTRDANLTISQIGALSVNCRHHIMIATGPMWPTLNTHSHHSTLGRRRIVLLDNKEELGMPNILQLSQIDQLMGFVESEGWV